MTTPAGGSMVDADADADAIAVRARDAAEGVAHHYDVGNEFYALWLDTTLSYSCALRADDTDDLDGAQVRKLDHHLHAVRAERAESLLDVGCGWGAVMERAVNTYGVARTVGLTLSAEQADHVRAQRLPGSQVHTVSWSQYEPERGFDGVISIGAFEHFATPSDSAAEKIAVYRSFFERCRQWLNPGGTLSLQTIAYADMSRDSASPFMQQEIFPNADLPTFSEIAAAADGLFEIAEVRNGRADYAWTCAQWASRLDDNRTAATEIVGPDVVARYRRYLKQSALGFAMGKITLYRLVLMPHGPGHRRAVGATVR